MASFRTGEAGAVFGLLPEVVVDKEGAVNDVGEELSREGEVGGKVVLPPEALGWIIVGSVIVFYISIVIQARVERNS